MADTKENDAPKSENIPDTEKNTELSKNVSHNNNDSPDKTSTDGTQGNNTRDNVSSTDGTVQSTDNTAQTNITSSGAKPKVLPNANQKTGDVEKHQEQKLLSKYPGLSQKSGGNKFLQKRLAKGKNTFFDSGDYNMPKVQENRQSAKVVSKAPTRIAPDSSGESDHHSEEEFDEDNFDPAKQAIPTPDLLFMRRAARHMPMTSPLGPGGPRRATMQTRGISDPGVLGDSELVSDGPVVNPNVMARRRATLQVPSKLAD